MSAVGVSPGIVLITVKVGAPLLRPRTGARKDSMTPEEELKQLIDYENNDIPLIMTPPGTRYYNGTEVGDAWIWGALAPLWMIQWNRNRQKELREIVESSKQ